MTAILQLLEQIGQNSSLNEFDSVGQLLAEQNISEEEINKLVDSNIPLICAWIPEDDDDKKDNDKEEEEKETDSDKKIN